MLRIMLFSILSLTLIYPVHAEEDSNTAQITIAVASLLEKARQEFDADQIEQAAATLERALRIDSGNPVLWHNLAGVRLQQENWERAANLAYKSNSKLHATNKVDKVWLQIRNWTIIGLACKGMGDKECENAAKRRAYLLATQ
jgi:Tfp pilus assembly protein PilF